MRAAVIPDVGATWEVREIPTPVPGPGQVLVRVHASGVCHNDVLATEGVFPFPDVRPAVTGHEPAGEVVEVGAGVTGRRVGDRVGTTWVQGTCGRCDYCRLGLPLSGQAALNCEAARTTGFTVPGGHAEYMVVDAAGTVLLPDGLDYELAAPMLCAGYTAWCALRRGAPAPHERVAVLGIGGLGHLALQFARACGYETVAITHSPDKHELARELGADAVVSSGAELLDAGGADVVLVTGTSMPAATEAMAGLRVGGRLVLAGIDVAGSFTLEPDSPFFAQDQRILGSTHNGLGYLAEALDLAARRKVVPMVETYDLDRSADAVARVAAGSVRFRAVLTP